MANSHGAFSFWFTVSGKLERHPHALEFDGVVGLSYLDHALRGPLPIRTRMAVNEALEHAARGRLARPSQSAAISDARAAVARLLGWPASSISFVSNTTSAIATFAAAMRWCVGDRILIHADEEPSHRLPWRAVADAQQLRVVELEARGRKLAKALERACAEWAPRVVALSAVCLATGERRDLEELGEISERFGALLVVDAAQGLGSVQMELAGVAAVAACGRKWLCGPPEIGILAIRAGLEDELRVPAAGGCSMVAGEWRPGAERFEGGVVSAPLLAGLRASIGLLEEVGLATIERRVLALGDEVRAAADAAGIEVLSLGGSFRSGVVWLRLPGAGPELEEALEARGVVVRAKEGRLRISPHYWCGSEDVASFFRALTDQAVEECDTDAPEQGS